MAAESLSGLQRLACPHSEATAPDDEGWHVCLRCGAAVCSRLTWRMLKAAMRDAN